MSSNLADEPTLADVLPPIQNCLMKKWQLHIFRNSQLIRKYKEILVYIRIQIPKADGPPPFETARALSELYAFQCCQWEPIQNSQLIRKYKEIPVYIRIQIPKADGPPPIETARALSEVYAFQCCQWEPIWNSQLIRKYKEIPVYIRIQIPKADGSPPRLKLPEL